MINHRKKTLEIEWETRLGIRYTVPPWNTATKITKRIILSDFTKHFDPLGMIGLSQGISPGFSEKSVPDTKLGLISLKTAEENFKKIRKT